MYYFHSITTIIEVPYAHSRFVVSIFYNFIYIFFCIAAAIAVGDFSADFFLPNFNKLYVITIYN